MSFEIDCKMIVHRILRLKDDASKFGVVLENCRPWRHKGKRKNRRKRKKLSRKASTMGKEVHHTRHQQLEGQK